jgi:ribose 5-phosphate isomerase A
MDPKEVVAVELASRVKDSQIIGIGTGTTVEAALTKLAARVAQEHLEVRVVPSSIQTAWLCQDLGLTVMYAGYQGEITWGFDGADAVDERFWAIKGRGGAMLQEKILAARCRVYYLIIDESKLVTNIAAKAPVPVEVIPTGVEVARAGLDRLGAEEITLRAGAGKHGPVITEGGNLILDAKFREIRAGLEGEIKALVGVVESGLFLDYADEVLVGSAQGIRILRHCR